MRSDTAAQTGTTLFLAVVMTAALTAVALAGFPPLTAPVLPSPVSGSPGVLGVPLNLADLVAGDRDRPRTPQSAAVAEAPVTTGPTFDIPEARRTATRPSTSDVPVASRPKRDRSSVRKGGAGPAASDADPERRRESTQPPQPPREDDRGDSEPDIRDPGRDSTRGGSTSGGSDKTRPRPVGQPQRDRSVAQRDDRVKAAATPRGRSSVDREPGPTAKGKQRERAGERRKNS